MADKKLTLEFTLIDDEGTVATSISGSRGVVWCDILKDVMPKVYKSLANEGCDVEQTKAALVEQMARLSGKTVDEVKAELAAMDGNEYANVATLSAQYIRNAIESIETKKAE